ncbi:hypothetical protein MLD38_005110 [Melastoma candidum]|uniref:Uncharacterized protein n=1 Tax=Melastoma candidum TaxID=119954 RepID=A0ACB9S9R1_9MYRT|nr:hypothetical protein MLD38_005110 [Melastoma candidum]
MATDQQRLTRLTLEHHCTLVSVEYSFRSSDQEWVVTELNQWSKNLTSTDLLAIDFLDYRTTITGISAEDLVGVDCTLAEVQKTMKNLLLHGAMLVGLALSNDLKVLKFDYASTIDTSYICKNADNSIHLLLCARQFVLDYELRKEGAPHNCLDDSMAVMKLVLAAIDHGVSTELPNVPNEMRLVFLFFVATVVLLIVVIDVCRPRLASSPRRARQAPLITLEGMVEKNPSG